MKKIFLSFLLSILLIMQALSMDDPREPLIPESVDNSRLEDSLAQRKYQKTDIDYIKIQCTLNTLPLHPVYVGSLNEHNRCTNFCIWNNQYIQVLYPQKNKNDSPINCINPVTELDTCSTLFGNRCVVGALRSFKTTIIKNPQHQVEGNQVYVWKPLGGGGWETTVFDSSHTEIPKKFKLGSLGARALLVYNKSIEVIRTQSRRSSLPIRFDLSSVAGSRSIESAEFVIGGICTSAKDIRITLDDNSTVDLQWNRLSKKYTPSNDKFEVNLDPHQDNPTPASFVPLSNSDDDNKEN